MWISSDWKDYELLDCGGGERLERWGKYLLVRPDPQAIWRPEGTTISRPNMYPKTHFQTGDPPL